MPCYHPRRVIFTDRLRWDLDPRNREAFGDRHVLVACSKCYGCSQSMQRQWAVRAFHESLMHTEMWQDPETKISTEVPNSCVVTLTYDQEHLPADGALKHDDFQRFMKRLRIRRQRRTPAGVPVAPIRYFMCGEYGGKTHRPHFHAVLFGEQFLDSYYEQSRDGQVNRMSYELDELWSQPIAPGEPPTKIGRATVDGFSFAGASYVAGYVAKKQGEAYPGPLRERVDRRTGECTIEAIQPEYRRMSTGRGPAEGETWEQAPGGLGKSYALQPNKLFEIYATDSIRISEWRFRPPRYYDTLLKSKHPDRARAIKSQRLEKAFDLAEDWSPERCDAAEKIALSALQSRRDSL